MLALSLLTILLAGCSAVLFVRAVALPRMKSAERVKAIAHYGYDAAPPIYAAEHGPAFANLASRLGTVLARRLGTGPDDLRRTLVSAGFYKLSPAALLGYRALAAIAGGVMLLVATGGSSLALVLACTTFGVLFGWFIPVGYVDRAARHRMQEIDRELPDLIDLVVVTVEAGLTLPASLQLAVGKFDGPLAEELRLTLQEQRMGRSLHEALLGFLARCDTPNVRSFVRSVTQGENLGVSIGAIMRNLAEEMRKRRRSAAEKQAQKAPVKILFPLVFLILPAFVITILAPPVLNLFGSFGS